MFYKPLVDKLNSVKRGIVIGNQCYNALCYADDLMVMSTTVTGLQLLIDSAVKHITERGLLFNPGKTECYINGKNPFVSRPKWYIGESELKITDNINYLGVTLDSKRGLSHVELRISKAYKAFYSLQSAGLYSNSGTEEFFFDTCPRTSVFRILLVLAKCLLVVLIKNQFFTCPSKYQAIN